MKHQPVILDGDLLVSLMAEPECGWGEKEIAAALGIKTEMVEDEFGEIYENCPEPGDWWVVAWPEHVISPKYDSDATYHGPIDSQEAAAADWPEAIIHAQSKLYH